MRKGENINGYIILEDFIVAGGRSKISFARKGDKEYFIKEFLSPKYPMPGSPGSERVKEQKRKACQEFENHHRELNNQIAKKVSLGGNLVYAIDFFRQGTCYYKVTEKIDTVSLTCKEISEFSLDAILRIAKSVCHSIRILHELNIVHGDLKPDNILVKKFPSGYSGKLIDFDDSYFSGNPPKDREELVGTPEYYSPEQAAYIMDEDEEIDGSTLTLKSDIFTLGIIFCEYFTGEKPILPEGVKSTWACVNQGLPFKFAKDLPEGLSSLIKSMLSSQPDMRPTIHAVFEKVKIINTDGITLVSPPRIKINFPKRDTPETSKEEKMEPVPIPKPGTEPKSRLRGDLLNRLK